MKVDTSKIKQISNEVKSGNLILDGCRVTKQGNSWFLKIDPTIVQLGLLQEGEKIDASVNLLTSDNFQKTKQVMDAFNITSDSMLQAANEQIDKIKLHEENIKSLDKIKNLLKRFDLELIDTKDIKVRDYALTPYLQPTQLVGCAATV